MPEQSSMSAAQPRVRLIPPTEAEIAEACASVDPVPYMFRTDRGRRWSIGCWRGMSPHSRASYFKDLACGEIVRAQAHIFRHGLHHKKPQVHDYQDKAIEEFAQIVLIDQRDDKSAIEATTNLMCSLSYYDKGSIPNGILYVKACGPKARANLLKDAWLAGKSGSVLALNAPSTTMCLTYFKEANPRYLMTAKERRELSGIPGVVRLYRGARMKWDMRATAHALSWTPDYETAAKFGRGIGAGDGDGVVLAADVPRDGILVWWTESGREIEAIINPRRSRNVQIVEHFASAAA